MESLNPKIWIILVPVVLTHLVLFVLAQIALVGRLRASAANSRRYAAG